MSHTTRDQIVDQATRSVMTKPGIHATEAQVRALAGIAVDGLIDQPLQAFTPLLAENEVLTQLHRRGEAGSRARPVAHAE